MKVPKDPLVHFALAAGLLFAGYQFLDRSETNDHCAIRFASARVRFNGCQRTFTNQWQRPPTPDELNGLATNLLEEELFSREAKSLGLDQNDTIVRRRLAQKLDFLIADSSRISEPEDAGPQELLCRSCRSIQNCSDDFLQACLFQSGQANRCASRCARGPCPDIQRRNRTRHDRRQLLVDAEFTDTDFQTVSSLFGTDFAKAAFAMPQDAWAGPVPSGFGLHLVRVTKLRPAETRPFDQVRNAVAGEWRRQQEREIREAYIAKLKEKYGVDIADSVKPLLEPGSLSGTGQ